MDQWLRPCTWNAGAIGWIPDWEIKIPYAAWHHQKINKKEKVKRKRIKKHKYWKGSIKTTIIYR